MQKGELACLGVLGFGWKLLEDFLYPFAQFIFVLLRLVGERVRRYSPEITCFLKQVRAPTRFPPDERAKKVAIAPIFRSAS